MKRKLRFDEPSTWVRGSLLGSGGYGSVYLATVPPAKKHKLGLSPNEPVPSVFAVKSASPPECFDLCGEGQCLDALQGCPHIIDSFGSSVTLNERGDDVVFNLFLEFASGGTLLDLVRSSGEGEGLPESEVRRHARSVLVGLEYIHRKGYVHCDLKPENVLLVADQEQCRYVAKIGDFGLVKKAGWGFPVRGTTMYLSPEAAVHRVQEAPADVWAFGCIVLQLLTGRRPWTEKIGWTAKDLLKHIGTAGNLPRIRGGVSELGRNFLELCFSRNPRSRWTAKQLLSHPYVAEIGTGKLTVGVGEKEVLPEYSPGSGICDVIIISSD